MDYIIIVAGGKGLRMGGEIPKQFLPIGGKPVLMHTLERFHRCDKDMKIILVLPKSQQDYWRELCREYRCDIPHEIADGGDTRFASSKNGLALIAKDCKGVVGIHDGVRPFVSAEVIRRCYDIARQTGAAIPVLPVTDTLRKVGDTDKAYNVLRSNYRIVQTPQVFDIQLAHEAFDQPYSDAFTDDASVVESIGKEVTMVEGNRENIKLTTPFDLKIAEVLL
ncbi:MAG: 2-C-methyl-D-erythritol 4-phosphate cytidylyltransferase [Prevotella sp.]|nr:2-C-methyl-D-erythritol 4-phosphate cytidylyltransferase [Prevotella sp.]